MTLSISRMQSSTFSIKVAIVSFWHRDASSLAPAPHLQTFMIEPQNPVESDVDDVVPESLTRRFKISACLTECVKERLSERVCVREINEEYKCEREMDRE